MLTCFVSQSDTRTQDSAPASLVTASLAMASLCWAGMRLAF